MQNTNTNPQLLAQIKKWCQDFEDIYPSNLQIDPDDETMEGSAYNLFQKILADNK